MGGALLGVIGLLGLHIGLDGHFRLHLGGHVLLVAEHSGLGRGLFAGLGDLRDLGIPGDFRDLRSLRRVGLLRGGAGALGGAGRGGRAVVAAGAGSHGAGQAQGKECGNEFFHSGFLLCIGRFVVGCPWVWRKARKPGETPCSQTALLYSGFLKKSRNGRKGRGPEKAPEGSFFR